MGGRATVLTTEVHRIGTGGAYVEKPDTLTTNYFYMWDSVRDGGQGFVSDTGSVIQKRNYSQSGPFRSNSGRVEFGDFDQAYDAINPNSDRQAGSTYVVQDGDTLQSIASSVWGDANLWYLIADANGLDSESSLLGGMSIAIPAKVSNLHNTASTFRPYDPNEAIGNISPTRPKPAKAGCGIVGQIIVQIVATVVAMVVNHFLPGSGTYVHEMIVAAVTEVASQETAVALGMQDKMHWGQVGMAVVTAGVSKGFKDLKIFEKIDRFAQTVSKAVPQAIRPVVQDFVAGAASQASVNAATQGVGVATGLQRKFSWTAVAAAGVQGGVSSAVTGYMDRRLIQQVQQTHPEWKGAKDLENAPDEYWSGHRFSVAVGGMAGSLAGATARSVMNGGDFGDNILATLPDMISFIIGNQLEAAVGGAEKAVALSKTTNRSGGIQPVGASPGTDLTISAGGYIDPSEWAEGGGIPAADGLQIQSTSGRLNSDNVVVGRSFFSDEGNPFATWAAVSKSGLNFSDGLNFVTSDGGAWAQFEAGGHKVVLNDIFFSAGQWVHHGTWDGESKIFTDNAAVPLQYVMDGKVVDPAGNKEVEPVVLYADKKTWGSGVSRFMYEPVIFSNFDYREMSDIGPYCPVGTSLQRTSFGGPVIQRVRAPDQGLLRIADDYEATNNPVAAARARLRAQDPDAADAYLKSGATKQFYNDTISLFETAFVAGTGNPDLLDILPRIPRADILPEERTGAKTVTSVEIAGTLFTPWSVGDVLIPGRLGGTAAAGVTGYRPLLLTSPEGTESLFAAETVEAGAINPRLITRLGKWRDYQAGGGTLDIRSWIKATQGQEWGLGGRGGYSDWITRVESTHGNSLFSNRPASLYEMYDRNTDEFLKHGITQDLSGRYSAAYLADKRVIITQTGPRSQIAPVERFLEETQPGRLNRQPWAVKAWNQGLGRVK